MIPAMAWSCAAPSSSNKRGPSKRSAARSVRVLLVRLLLAAALLTCLGLTSPTTSAEPSSPESVVVFSAAEAESILAHIDYLEIELWEARATAQTDSAYAARLLELERQAHEDMLEVYRRGQDNWLQRLIKQPVIWLGLGMYIGVQSAGG